MNVQGTQLTLHTSEDSFRDGTWSDWYSPAAFQREFPDDPSLSLTDFLQDGHATTNIEGEILWDAKPSLEVMYVFLDDDQMKMFATSEHTYLVTTVRHHEFANLSSTEQNLKLYLYEPVKELVWMAYRNDFRKDRNDWFNFTNYMDQTETEAEHLYKITTRGQNMISLDAEKKRIVKTSQIFLNNQPRIQEKTYEYFSQLQPFWYFNTTIPDGIHVFSFSLNPKEFQPSGSCNMAQVKKVDLRVKIADPPQNDIQYDMSVYSVGYNILRIQNGTGGLAFST